MRWPAQHARPAAVVLALVLAACGSTDETLSYWRGVNAMDDGRPDLARSELAAYLERVGEGGEYASEARRLLARSWGMGGLQSPGRAEPWWRSILAEEPNDSEARSNLARCLLQLGRASGARELLERGNERPPTKVDDELLGAALLDLDPAEALTLATGRMATRPEAPLLAAKAAELLGDDEATLRYARQAVALQPLNATAHYLLSRALRRTGDLAGARVAAERHRDATSLEARGGATPGAALDRLRALDRLAAALAVPTPEVQALRLDLSIDAGLREQGRRLLDEALSTPERFAATPSRLAGWAERLGDLRQARALLEEALADETDAAARRSYQHRLGRLYRALDDDRVEDLLREALTEQPNVGRFHCAVAGVAAAAGRSDDAIASYEAALRLAPWRADCRVELARLLHVEGERTAVEELLALAPEPAPELSRFGKEFGYAAP